MREESVIWNLTPSTLCCLVLLPLHYFGRENPSHSRPTHCHFLQLSLFKYNNNKPVMVHIATVSITIPSKYYAVKLTRLKFEPQEITLIAALR